MIVCLDVDYRGNDGIAAAVVLDDWQSLQPAATHLCRVRGIAPYVPGEFFKRELPCLLAVLALVTQSYQVIIIDGHVMLPGDKPGLGAHLFGALQRHDLTLVGVAKTAFAGTVASPVLRGGSHKPLFVDEIGPFVDAAQQVASMPGAYRVPAMLKRVDRLCREA